MLATEEALEHEAQRERLKQMKEFAAALSVLSTSSATTDMRMELAGMVQKGADYYEEGLEDEASRSLDVSLPDMEVLEERYQEDDKLRQKVDHMLLSLSQVRVCVLRCVCVTSHRAQNLIPPEQNRKYPSPRERTRKPKNRSGSSASSRTHRGVVLGALRGARSGAARRGGWTTQRRGGERMEWGVTTGAG